MHYYLIAKPKYRLGSPEYNTVKYSAVLFAVQYSVVGLQYSTP